MRTLPKERAAALDWEDARRRCLREARRYTRSPAEAEDVVQEALLRAWRTRATLRDPARPMPWLLQITRNEALRALARAARERKRVVLIADPDPDPGPGLEGWTDAVILRTDVAAILRQLGEDDRRLATLRYSADLTHATIAGVMGTPVGTCKVRLHRLRKRLGALLAEEGPA